MSEQQKQFDPTTQGLQYGIYKNQAALRIRLAKPFVTSQNGRTDLNQGYVFLEMAPVKEFSKTAKTYKWEAEKIGVKLGMNDLQELCYAFSRGIDCELFHKFGDATKVISLKRSEPGGKSPYFLAVSQNNKGEKASISIPVSAPEAFALSTLLQHSIPAILNW